MSTQRNRKGSESSGNSTEAEPDAPLSETDSPTSESEKQKHYDFFLCHTGDHKGFVDMVMDEIKKEDGISIFFDEDVLLHGDQISDIPEHLENSKRVVVFIDSNEFIGKKWPMFELATSLKKKKKLFPVILSKKHLFDSRMQKILREDGYLYPWAHHILTALKLEKTAQKWFPLHGMEKKKHLDSLFDTVYLEAFRLNDSMAKAVAHSLITLHKTGEALKKKDFVRKYHDILPTTPKRKRDSSAADEIAPNENAPKKKRQKIKEWFRFW